VSLRAIPCASLVLAFAAAAAPARAQPADTAAAADALFNEGKRLMLEKRFAEACPKLEQSNRLDPGIGVLLFLADCLAQTGRTASAWSTFREAAALARREKDPRERVAFEKAAQMEPRVWKITVVVAPERAVKGLVVTRDGIDVPPATWNVESAADPGKHNFSASAPGRKTWGASVVGSEGGRYALEVPPLEEETPGSAPAPRPRVAPATAEAQAQAQTSPGGVQRTIAIAAAGVGVAGLAVGTIFGIEAMSNLGTIHAHCSGTSCDSASAAHTRDDARSNASVSTVAFVVGGILVAGGAALYFTAPAGATVSAGVARDGAFAHVGRAF
jgi:hypothetical protein